MPAETEERIPENQTAILSVDQVAKQFPVAGGQVLTACENVCIDIRKGETVGIVGESGCGKSTLVKVLLGMHEPTEGRVLFRGEDITKLSGEAKRQNYRRMQMVFQDPTAAFNPKMLVKDIICEPLLNFDLIAKKEVKAKAEALLELVDLPPDFAERYPHNMSGGQRQRVAIARALALEPEIIVCDEATSALDVSVQHSVIELLVRLQKEKGITYIFICHDLALVQLFAHRVVVMYLGNVVEKLDGSALASARHPYTQALLKSVFPVHVDDPVIETLQGEIPNPLDMPTGCPFQTRCPLVETKCRREKPRLREVADNHFVACHRVTA